MADWLIVSQWWERGWAVADINWKGIAIFVSGVCWKVNIAQSKLAGKKWYFAGKSLLFQGMELPNNDYYIWLCSSEKEIMTNAKRW